MWTELMFARGPIALSIAAALSLSVVAPSAAYDELYTDYPLITVDGLLHSGTLSTWPESASAFYFNPAATTASLLPVLSHNHSGRHFPSEDGGPEMDQLDNDFESVIVPLPLGSFALGFSLFDEQGYDFTNHPPGWFPYKREQVKGDETWVAYALGACPYRYGLSYRRLQRACFPERSLMPVPGTPQPQSFPEALVSGEGHAYGWLAGLPWLRAASSRSQLDMRKLALPVGVAEEARKKEKRRGWRVQPLAWLSIAGESRKITTWPFCRPGAKPEPSTIDSISWSVSARPFVFLEVGYGVMDGKRSWGCKLKLPFAGMKYAEVKDYLQTVTGQAVSFFGDIHLYGVDIMLF